jgi:hypothetical protein
MSNCCICGFLTHILVGILIFKGLTARRLYKSFGVKGLRTSQLVKEFPTFSKNQSFDNSPQMAPLYKHVNPIHIIKH